MILRKRDKEHVENIIKHCTDNGMDRLATMRLWNHLVRLLKKMELLEARASKTSVEAGVTQQTWALEDHICRHCGGGRILRCVTGNGMTAGGNPIYMCADCGRSKAHHGPDALCWCGMSLRNNTEKAYMCLPFSAITENLKLKDAFLSCGSDPARGMVGIMTKAAYRKATEETCQSS